MVVVVRLFEGLGNQLFQYAAGLSLATHHGTDLRLDASFLQKRFLRWNLPFSLNLFRIDGIFASQDDIARFRGAGSDLLNRARLFSQQKVMLPLFKSYNSRSIFIERKFTFDPDFFKSPRDVYLVGYWQSEKYFSAIRDILLKKLELKEKMSRESVRIAKMITQTRAFSVHVRRGDYVSDPKISRFHGTCPPNYYENCARLIREKVSNPHFFVFSDEPDWAMRNLKLGDKTTFVTSNGPSRPHEDLKLMSMCEGHIIANSSFSWWGAWLNRNPNKIVLAPRRWTNAPLDTRDLIPDGWIRM